MIRVCICGGGSLAHVCAGVLSSHSEVEVNIFTRQPERWSHHLIVTDHEGKVYKGELNVISNKPQEAMRDCNIIFFCLPGFAIESTLKSIKPYIENAVIGSIVCSTGFFFASHKIQGEKLGCLGSSGCHSLQGLQIMAMQQIYLGTNLKFLLLLRT